MEPLTKWPSRLPDYSDLVRYFILTGVLVSFPFIESSLEESFLTLVLVLLASLLFLLRLVREGLRFPKPVFPFLIIFSLYLLVATSFSPVLYNSVLALLRWFAVLLIFIFIGNYFSKKSRQPVFEVVFLSAGVLALLGAYYDYLLSETPLPERYMYGVVHSYNDWGSFLLYFLPLSCSLGILSKDKKKRGIFFLLSVAFLAALVLTRARAAWMGGFFGLAFLSLFLLASRFAGLKKDSGSFFRQLKELFIFYVALGLLTLGLLFLIGSPGALLGRFSGMLRITQPEQAAVSQTGVRFDTSLIHRRDLWQNSWRMITDHPLFGVGLENFGRFYHQYQTQAWVYARDPHNTYLQLAVEVGPLGLVLFLALFASVLYFGRPFLGKLRRRPQENPFVVGVLAVFAAVLAQMFLEHNFNLVSNQIYFWSLLGFLVGVFVTDAGGSSLRSLSTLELGVVGMAVLLLVTVSFIFYRAVTLFQYAELTPEAQLSEAFYRRSIKLNPWQPFSYERLAVHKFREKDYAGARELLRQSLALDPTIPEVYGELAVTYYSLGDLENTERYLKKAIEIGPYTTPRYYNALAAFYREQGEEEEAYKVYLRAYENFPLNEVRLAYRRLYSLMDRELAETYTELSGYYRQRGEEEKAQRILTELVDGLSEKK